MRQILRGLMHLNATPEKGDGLVEVRAGGQGKECLLWRLWGGGEGEGSGEGRTGLAVGFHVRAQGAREGTIAQDTLALLTDIVSAGELSASSWWSFRVTDI